ncbi:MAG TPA: lytic transglycosylase domain-containing protein [Chitinophagaceae bacterium]|nr:lytic transglycosylase domain-containing protein [Chitinophagaceae bacterium]
MFRQKLYSAGLLIYCSLINVSNIQKGSTSAAKTIVDHAAIISQQSSATPSVFDLNPMALVYAKDYLKKNSWDLERVKKNSRSELHIINSVFSKFNIPPELKYLAVVESNLDADTVCNSTGATGIWQLMPVTACELGLKINDEVDERLQVYKSSTAAAKYLKQLYAEFGDWLLVVAAYNSGPVRVTRAINLSGCRNFWQLQSFLPAETRNHVKRFMSVLYFFEEQSKQPQNKIAPLTSQSIPA